MTDTPPCGCLMSIRVLGEGCRYCQPQEYIDTLQEQMEGERGDAVGIEHTRDDLVRTLRLVWTAISATCKTETVPFQVRLSLERERARIHTTLSQLEG